MGHRDFIEIFLAAGIHGLDDADHLSMIRSQRCDAVCICNLIRHAVFLRLIDRIKQRACICKMVISETKELCLLVDNGSLRDHAVLFTRKLARKLEADGAIPVTAVSLAHSDQIPVEKLNGVPVPLLAEALESIAQSMTVRRVTILPLLMVGDGVIYQKISSIIASFSKQHPAIECRLARALVKPGDRGPVSIPAFMAKAVSHLIQIDSLHLPEVWVVDHGSPLAKATEMRDEVAANLGRILPHGMVSGVYPASMERREGKEYDFNEPLLETALMHAGNRGVKDVIVVKMFLQPGRHSGKYGDISGILRSVRQEFPTMRIHEPSQVFSQKDLISLLKVRLDEVKRANG